MAHHGSKLPEFMEREARRMNLGATGQHPRGKLADGDEGEIQIAVGNDPKTRTVLLNFGKDISFIGFSPEQALEVAEALQKHALAVRGIV